jgi:glutamate-1-semialdehyde aminotransferase
MEVIRNTAPKENFLQNVRKLANKFNKILIFDECSTGFRETFGGIYKKYGIEPDMVIYGKALGNGYPISCVVGKKEIMDTKRKTFISSTFWTERIGPAAALETLKIMEREKSWKIISKIGKKVKKNWQKLSLKYKIPLTIQGIPALTNFYFNDGKNNLKYRSFIIQYLLKKKYLASNIFYSSIAHTDEILDGYFSILDEAFYELSQSIKKQDLDQKLNYPISYNTFRK